MRKKIVLFLGIALVVAWILGVLRFNYPWVEILFDILLFPCGFIYMLYENYCVAHFNSSHFLNDEIVQMVLFVSLHAAQGYLYYLIYAAFKKRRLKNQAVC
jgi:hypothetical protein